MEEPQIDRLRISEDKEDRLFISPSGIGAYFHLQCDRFLALRTLRDSTGKASVREDTLHQKSVFEKGHRFELQLNEEIKLSKNFTFVDCTVDEKIESSIHRLKEAKPGEILWQTCFKAPESLLSATNNVLIAGINKKLEFTKMFPDYLLIEQGNMGKLAIVIIDAKCSKKMKLSHQVQVTLYTLVLEEIIKVNNLDHICVANRGAVWLPSYRLKKDEQYLGWETFQLETMKTAVAHFLLSEVTNILSEGVPGANWRLNEKCQTCKFVRLCKKEALASNDVSLLPWLNESAWWFLRKLLMDSRDEISKHHREFERRESSSDLEDLAVVLRNENILNKHLSSIGKVKLRSILKVSRGSDKSPLIDVWTKEDKERIHICLTPLLGFPRYEDCAVGVTILMDPTVTSGPYSFSVVCEGRDCPEELSKSHIVRPNEAGSVDEFRKSSQLLIEHFSKLAEWHANSGGRMCLYFWGSAEDCLRNLLLGAVSSFQDNKELLEKAQKVALGFLRGPALEVCSHSFPNLVSCSMKKGGRLSSEAFMLEVDKQKKDREQQQEVLNPVTCDVLQVVKAVLVIPVPAVYNYSDVVLALDLMDRIAVSRLSCDSIFESWRNGAYTEAWESTTRRSRIILKIAKKLRRMIEDKAKAQDRRVNAVLLNEAAKYCKVQNFKNRDLGTLNCVVQLEALSDYLELRKFRISTPLELQIAKSCALVLRFEEEIEMKGRAVSCRFSFYGDEELYDSGMSNDGDSMKRWIITEIKEDFKLSNASIKFRDILWAQEFKYWGYSQPLTFACVSEFNWELKRVVVELEYHKGFTKLNPGSIYCLQKRYIDFTTTKISKILRVHDDERDSVFRRFVSLGIEGWCGAPLSNTSPDVIKNLASSYNFSPSQLEIFRSVVDRRLQVIWGPPGSGKTYFLALTILCLMEAHLKFAPAGTHLRIFLTAFTNSAIQNLLERVATLRNEMPPLADVPICLLVRLVRTGPPKLQTLGVTFLTPTSSKVGKTLAQRVSVIAGTVWQLNKQTKTLKSAGITFDTMIIDEASQLPVWQASIPFHHFNPEGRLIMAGDWNQMPPIINDYKGYGRLGDLASSILDWVAPESRRGDHGEGLEYVAKLKENWRMCHELGHFTKTLYGADYEAQYPNQQLKLRDVNVNDEYPLGTDEPNRLELSLCLKTLSGLTLVQITPWKAPSLSDIRDIHYIEAWIVAGLLKRYVQRGGSNAYVVTPHHAQRRAVNSTLRRVKIIKEDNGILVDTVEKMQGRECELVIVCYGFLDRQQIEAEAEFIMNRNRLNVSVSRARAKVITIVSDLVLQPSTFALGGEVVKTGLGYLKLLQQYSQTINYTIDENVTKFINCH